jgi:hypothetical protein
MSNNNINYNNNVEYNYNNKYSRPYMSNPINEDVIGNSLLEIKKRKKSEPSSSIVIELIPCINNLT